MRTSATVFILLCLISFARAGDVTITVPEDKAKTWLMMPLIIEKCTQDLAFRGDLNVCLQARNFVSELSNKIKNELDAQQAQKKP